MAAIKELIKKVIPQSWLLAYHYWLAHVAAILYWFPSEYLIVIGVTGTNGKSTTVNLIAKILEEAGPAGEPSGGAGHKVGLISTVNFKIAGKEWLNNLKMTMPGRFQLQKMLRQMAQAGCKYAVIETSSEGILQHRHLGINYDVAVFTNLTAEHLSAHGGFAGYKQTKLKLFAQTALATRKKIFGRKVLVANRDDRHAYEFLNFPAEEKVEFSLSQAKNLKLEPTGIYFQYEGLEFNLKLLGSFDVMNSLAAIATAKALGIDLETCKKVLEKVEGIPGRMEKIIMGQPFTVLVDYSPEPVALALVYKTLERWPKNKIIHVLGSTGGGRDRARRPILGFIAGANAAVVIVTNEDPYDDDPQEIIDNVAVGAEEAGKIAGESLFKILDRRAAIKKALELAGRDDLVLITGKGAEQAMVVRHNKKIPWDDRQVAREELKRIGYPG